MNTENNILLAEFIGGKYNGQVSFHLDSNEIWLPKFGICNYNNKFGKTLDFDTDWDWLMVCVDKIDSLTKNNSYSYYVEICRDSCYIHENDFEAKTLFCNSVPNNRLESCYLTVVQFVQWFNLNKTKKV